MMEKIALIPGTFDPITVGHMELVRVAAGLFDRVIVCIFVNPEKKHLFDEETRLSLLRDAVREYPNVTVDIDHGYTADYAKKVGAMIDCGLWITVPLKGRRTVQRPALNAPALASLGEGGGAELAR